MPAIVTSWLREKPSARQSPKSRVTVVRPAANVSDVAAGCVPRPNALFRFAFGRGAALAPFGPRIVHWLCVQFAGAAPVAVGVDVRMPMKSQSASSVA